LHSYSGGGNGGYDGSPDISAVDGLPNAGGGGGGGIHSGGIVEDLNRGHGGSGIVIIRHKSFTPGTSVQAEGYLKYDASTEGWGGPHHTLRACNV